MPLSRKLAALIIEEKASLSEVFALLEKYKLLALLPSIKEALIQMSSHSSREDTVMIESPFPLSEDSIQYIKNIAGDTTKPHEVIINKKILAGFKAKFRGMMYDGSAERIIKQLVNSH